MTSATSASAHTPICGRCIAPIVRTTIDSTSHRRFSVAWYRHASAADAARNGADIASTIGRVSSSGARK